MANELIQIPFHGDVIEAMRTEDGKVLVPLRRPCENLGLDPDGQRRKLKNKPWACADVISVHDNSGRNQDMFCLPLDAFPMWLATIEPSRVKPEIRARLELYQKEAARVLADHFFGRKQEAPDLVGVLEAMSHRHHEEMAAHRRETLDLIERMMGERSGEYKVLNGEGLMSINSRINQVCQASDRKLPRAARERIIRRVVGECLEEGIVVAQRRNLGAAPYEIPAGKYLVIDKWTKRELREQDLPLLQPFPRTGS